MSRDEKPAIGIFGAGWVGLVTGACLADLGHDVVVRDVVAEKIDALRSGRLPFHERGLEELLARNRERLTFTLEIDEVVAPLMFVCVGTPRTYSGDADLSAVWAVVDELPALEERAILVMKSTVPVGTGEKVRARLDARGLTHVGYAANPEFLAEGSAVRDFMHPDRVVVGAYTEADAATVAALYERLDAPIVRADVASAEMIKLAANAFLMTRISFINEIANVCEATGADVEQVAEGIGLDHRLGPHFLRAGIGWGGSCLAGDETILIRRAGRIHLLSLEQLFLEISENGDQELAFPGCLEVLSWTAGATCPEFFPVAAATRRRYRGELLEVRTKMGRRIRCTPDHPFVVGDGRSATPVVKLAENLTRADWIPIAQGVSRGATAVPRWIELSAMAGRKVATGRAEDAAMVTVTTIDEPNQSGEFRMTSGKEPTSVPSVLEADAAFWRVVGLYIAEGHCSWNRSSQRLFWSFHPKNERRLAEEIVDFWQGYGVRTLVLRAPTALHVVVSSRVLASWWLNELGLGRTAYDQRIPDLIWGASVASKASLLSGLWTGDGSWSYVNHGPNVVLEYGTVSRMLADGVLRLLGDLEIVARMKVGRTKKSTRDTYWLVVSGGHQVERLLTFVSERDRAELGEALTQTKRIAPTGYRRIGGTAWARLDRLSRLDADEFVYSLEVPGPHTFVTTGGLIVDNCFPKDGVALKQLASNSGYHFQLLNAVIEVNELQKRRVVGKLEKHLGKLRGKTVALLGLAFKPNTDDLREAPSLVLASRLLAEGADVRAWDPVADARHLLQGVTFCDSVHEAITDADAAVIVTEWEELKGFAVEDNRRAMRRPVIVDGRNMLDPEQARAAGFVYEGIGRAASPLSALPEIREPERQLEQ